MSLSPFHRQVRHCDPIIVQAAMQYLDYCESRCTPTMMRKSDWDKVIREKLTTEEMATKTAALALLNTWMLGDIKLQVVKGESLPPRVSAAIEYLSHCQFGGCDELLRCFDSGLKEARELDEAERAVKSTALELLRNWFTGELELDGFTNRLKIFKRHHSDSITAMK